MCLHYKNYVINAYFVNKMMLYLNWCFASNIAYFVDKIMLYLNWCFASNIAYFVDKIMLYLNWCFASNNAYFVNKIRAVFQIILLTSLITSVIEWPLMTSIGNEFNRFVIVFRSHSRCNAILVSVRRNISSMCGQ